MLILSRAPPTPPSPLIRSKTPDAFDVPELRDAHCHALAPPPELGELRDLIDSADAGAARWIQNASLAPDIVEAIMAGRQPSHLTTKVLT